MFELPIEKTGQVRRIGWSVTAHAVVLIAFFAVGHRVRIRPTSLPGTPQGARLELSYLPGGLSSSTQQQARKPAPRAVKQAKLELPPEIEPVPQPATLSSVPSAGEASASSNDALGTDDIRIALTTFSPSPKPDLTHLPHGAQGDVVLDITIDPTGQVADLQILQTLGYGVDGAVAATVRTWKFSPATKDGVPVASVQELHFHYGPV
jgi:protein TonB